MIGDGGVTVGLIIVPDLVAPGRLAVKSKAKRLEPLDDLSVLKAGQAAHIKR
jgi:hypothetical protein